MTRPDMRDECEALAEEHAAALARVASLEADCEARRRECAGLIEAAFNASARAEVLTAALRVYAYGRDGHTGPEVAKAALGPAEVNPERCPCGKGPVDWGGLCVACWEEEKLEHPDSPRCGFGLVLPEKPRPAPAAEALGAYIRACRLRAGLTLGQLRDQTAIGLTRLSDIERGRGRPPVGMEAYQLCLALDPDRAIFGDLRQAALAAYEKGEPR